VILAHTQDDSFHEIQLNGKQLVFFFMAATVVLVVVFLCGVLVGRGVRTERGGTVAENAGAVPNLEPTAAPAVRDTPPAGADPKAAPPQPPDELTYANRLQTGNSGAEVLKAPDQVERSQPNVARAVAPPAPKPPAVAAEKVTPPPPERAAPTPVEKAVPAAFDNGAEKNAEKPVAKAAAKDAVQAPVIEHPEPKGGSFVVQVAALNVRSEADVIAKRLASKGYEAYVLESAPGSPRVYRVRVGKFGTRREAQSMATKLQKEEQFKPWVTR
jgi:cell division septation protein DedD